jgi:hypothetical protein
LAGVDAEVFESGEKGAPSPEACRGEANSLLYANASLPLAIPPQILNRFQRDKNGDRQGNKKQ